MKGCSPDGLCETGNCRRQQGTSRIKGLQREGSAPLPPRGLAIGDAFGCRLTYVCFLPPSLRSGGLHGRDPPHTRRPDIGAQHRGRPAAESRGKTGAPRLAWRLAHLQGVCEAQPCQLLPLERRLGILAVALGLSCLLDSMLLWASALTDTQSPDSKSPL